MSPASQVEVDALGRAAGTLLARPVAGTELVRGGLRSDVARVHLAGPAEPRSVIVKAARTADTRFHDEWSALQYLCASDSLDARWPRLLASDAPCGVLVLEDLSDAPSLADLLGSPDRDAAARALEDTAHALGRLHASCRDSAVRHLVDVPRCVGQAREFAHRLGTLRELAQRVGTVSSLAFEAEVSRVADRFADPGRWLTFTVGDMAPTNVLLTERGPVFIDFEYAGLRHAFYDAMFWRCICPFPDEIADAMEVHYLAGLAAAGLRRSDPTEVRSEMALLCAHRMLWSLTWDVASLLERDREMAPGESGRALILTWLAGTRSLLSASGELPAVSDWLEALARALERSWPSLEQVGFTAFRSFSRS